MEGKFSKKEVYYHRSHYCIYCNCCLCPRCWCRLFWTKEEIHKSRTESEKENKERRAELAKSERRLVQKEENVDRKMDAYEKKEEKLLEQSNRLRESQERVDALYTKQVGELERISGLTSDEAKKELLDSVQEEVKHDKAKLIKDMEQEARDTAETKAREIISLAIQRCAADQVAETTVTVVPLPNDEMKGPHWD